MVLVARTDEAWQYQEDGDIPPWVKHYIERRHGELLLSRLSGKQLLLPGEWLVRNLDGDPDWYTDGDFNETFKVVIK